LAPAISSWIARRSWPGATAIQTLLSAMRQRITPHHLLRGYRVHTLLCRGSGLPLLFLLSPANVYDAPFAQPLVALAVRLCSLRPRIVRLDTGFWGLRLVTWIQTVVGAVAVVPWNPKRQKKRDGLPPTWTAEELGRRTGIERFFGRVFSLFGLFRL
jgi:hypothetical protein